ncbi:MAG: Response regulator of zinc sigma-54-dependent two-component system [bacterium]|nr:Response regulator of zinc sigma-54-dependent two-component system [bacterium]
MSGAVLIVDDDAAMCAMLAKGLGRKGFACQFRTAADDALALMETESFDVVVTDLNMRAMAPSGAAGGVERSGISAGLELCARVVANRPDVPVVVITAFGSLETAVGAIRAGAYDFITKPVEIDALAMTLSRAVEHRALREEVRRLRHALAETRRFDEMIGESAPMRKLQALLAQIVDSPASVLITGESGTGKELVARALHKLGARKSGPFVAINCAAMPETLLESELFGHAKGAFTDARADRAGLFVQASGGTLFLDEIGDMPPGMQAKLLRALQERKVRPVGGSHEVPFDVRVVAATNRDLDSAVAEQRFREDLYFRINVIQVAVPPLRARGNDVLVLAQSFLERFAARSSNKVTGLGTAVAERLLAYQWPGNVRELQNAIERAVAVTQFSQITVEDLPERIRDYHVSHVLVAGEDPSELSTMEEVERRYIARVMQAVGGNKTLAAKVLGFDRKTLYNKLDKHGTDKS